MEKRYMVSTQEFMNSYYNFLEVKNEFGNMSRENEILYLTFLSGCTKKFELLFDQSWKAIKAVLVEYYGVTNFVQGSPRDVLKKAYELDVISCDTWLDMLNDRNDGTHMYKERQDLESYIDKIFSLYSLMYGELCEKFVKIRSESNRFSSIHASTVPDKKL